MALGGEHSITPPLVSAAARQFPGLSVLQIDAHADMRDSYMGTVHNHACAMRRALQFARVTQVGIRSLSTEEAEALPKLKSTVFYDVDMRRDPKWIDAVVASLAENVYVTIDVDGLDPAIMPVDRYAGTGRAVVDRDHRPAPGHRGAPPDRRRRHRGVEPDPGAGGAEFPVREAALQVAHLPLRC